MHAEAGWKTRRWFARVGAGLVVAATLASVVSALWSLEATATVSATTPTPATTPALATTAASARPAPAAVNSSRASDPRSAAQADKQSSGDPQRDGPEEIRTDTKRILSREDFSYKKGYLERFLEWLADRLGNREVSTPKASGGFLSGIIGTVLAWVILLAAIAAVVFIVARYVRFRRPKLAKEKVEAPDAVIEHNRSVKEWNSEAERLEADGDWKQAIRARYRMLVRELTDRGQLPDIAGSTTTELREALAETTPSATGDFDAASALFELPWYAAEETGPEENAQIRRLSDEILAVER